MKLITKHAFAVLLGFLTITVHIAAQAEGLVLTGPPRETPEAGLKMYDCNTGKLSHLVNSFFILLPPIKRLII